MQLCGVWYLYGVPQTNRVIDTRNTQTNRKRKQWYNHIRIIIRGYRVVENIHPNIDRIVWNLVSKRTTSIYALKSISLSKDSYYQFDTNFGRNYTERD